MDDCEQSSVDDSLSLRMAIDGARSRQSAMASRTTCIDCGNTIPEARRNAVHGCTRCVFCQETHERTGL